MSKTEKFPRLDQNFQEKPKIEKPPKKVSSQDLGRLHQPWHACHKSETSNQQ